MIPPEPIAPGPAATVTIRHGAVTPSRAPLAPIMLSVAAIGLAMVGIVINARSLGSSDVAGLLFLGIGLHAAAVSASCIAFATSANPEVEMRIGRDAGGEV